MWFFIRIKKSYIHLKIQGMKSLISKKALNFAGNKLNCKSAKAGLSNGMLINFATLRRRNLAGGSLFQVFFFFGFLYYDLNCTNQRNFKKKSDILREQCATCHGMAYIYKFIYLFIHSFFHSFFYSKVLKWHFWQHPTSRLKSARI